MVSGGVGGRVGGSVVGCEVVTGDRPGTVCVVSMAGRTRKREERKGGMRGRRRERERRKKGRRKE